MTEAAITDVLSGWAFSGDVLWQDVEWKVRVIDGPWVRCVP